MSGSNEYSLARASLGYDTDGNNIEISGLNKKSTTNESGGISSGVGAIGAAIINAISQAITNKKNRDFAAEQARLQNQWNIEQWNRENAYNTPAAQMQRYIDAGLNPNLIVGQQNLAASSPQLVSGKDAPAGVAPQLPVDLPLQAAQIRNLNANTALQESQSDLTLAQIKSTLKSLELSDANIDLIGEQILYYQQCVSNLKLDQQKTSEEIFQISESARSQWIENEFNSATFDDRVKQFAANSRIDEAKARNIVKYITATIAGLHAQANYYLSLAKLNEADTKRVQELSRELSMSNSLTWAFYHQPFTYSSDGKNFETRTGFDWTVAGLGQQALADYKFGFSDREAANRISLKTADLYNKYGDAEMLSAIINTWSNTISNLGSMFNYSRTSTVRDNPRISQKTKIGQVDTKLRLGR